VVNGLPQGLDGYVAIAAHFADTGTHVSGRAVRTQEFAFYRVAGGRIAEVWVTADNLAVREQLNR
jgi:predicted ester cyclase